MFDPVKELHNNPALFACYILFIYFRGRNAVRIEREMRALGHATFHRRNLYPRGKQPGWIAKYNWSADTLVRTDAASASEKSVKAPTSFLAASGDADKSVRTPSDFHTWLKRVSPNMTWDWRHQQVIIEQLKKVTTGDCKRLMIFLPPRHGKSELVSVRYTAWRMQQDPSMNVILGSYNERLADRMSRKIRTVICDSFTAETPRRGESGNSGPQIDTDKHRSRDRSENISVHQCSSVDENSPRLGVSAIQDGANPFPFARPKPKNAVSEWETAMGGTFRAVGAGSGVTGFGANLIVIDDPVKNRAQAESETFRNRVWDWYKDDLYTRLEPDGSIVLIQTRWHEDDLAGRLLRDDHDNWTIINLPALSEPGAIATGQFLGNEEIKQDEEDEQDAQGGNTSSSECAPLPLDSRSDIENLDQQGPHHVHPVHPVNEPPPRLSVSAVNRFDWRSSPNIALCPERFPVEALEQQRRQLGTYSFSALYQQRPSPAGGQIFKREWFKNIIDFAPPGLKWKRGYDLAVSTRTESDYTASFRCAIDGEGNLYIAGGFRRRIEFPEQRRYIIDRMLNERDTEHGVELALHGQALIQELRRDPSIRGRSLSGVKVSTDKLTRALTWSPLAEEGKVILVRQSVFTAEAQRRKEILKQDEQDIKDGLCDTEISPRINTNKNHLVHPLHPVKGSPQPTLDWINDLLDELTAFPNGTNDDQIDAISLAVQMLAKREFKARGYLIT